MKYTLVFSLYLLCFYNAFGQVQRYHAFSYEFIFSGANVKDAAGNKFDSGIRFSGFYNSQRQYHFDFNNQLGIYTGLGIENIGLITYPVPGIKLKQRAYGLNVPLAIKIGNMSTRKYISIGGMIDYFFNYKQKIFYDDSKKKSNKWFSDNKVNVFNPSVFVEAKFKYGLFIRARYFLLDFLKSTEAFAVNDATYIPGYSHTSKVFYLGVGINIRNDSKGQYIDLRP